MFWLESDRILLYGSGLYRWGFDGIWILVGMGSREVVMFVVVFLIGRVELG